MINNTAFIFPAFITEYTKKELDFLNDNQIDFNKYIKKANDIIGVELPEFSYESPIYKNDELLSQITAYLFSCAISDVLKQKSIHPQFVSGYSMGIYASLYAANSISIDDGIKLIYEAFKMVNDLSCSGEYGMGAIIGLSLKDVKNLISDNHSEAEIININNRYSLVIAGKKRDVVELLSKAKNEGALSVTELTVNTPYHSKYILRFSEKFNKFIQTLNIRDAEIPIVSTYDQRIIEKSSDIKLELVYNLTEKINWFKTMQKLIDLKINTFYECGAGKYLKKIARFIDGDYKIKSIYKI